MPSTYSSNLKIELMATGENSGTWGTVTNTNLGTALEQAIIGLGNPNYASDANLTISLTDSNGAQAARALVLNVTSGVSLSATRELVVPAIQKQYVVQNNTTGAQSITVKTASGTGITIPNGRKAHLYVDGVNVVQMVDYLISPTFLTPALGTPTAGVLSSCTGLPISSGVSGLGTNVATALAVNVGTSGAVVVNGGALGTPSGGTLTSCTGLPLTTGITGTLPVGNGGTGITSGTSGGVPYFSASNTIASSAALAASALVIGGGAGVAPSTTTTGTGVLTALGNNANAAGGFTTIDGTATLTNKRVTQRCNAQTTTASPFAWNSDSYDQQSFSALANALTINADAGTPTDGQRTVFRIKDNGTARALTWTTGSSKAFRAIGVTLPTTTVINKTVYVGCIYNAADDRWDAVAVAQEA